MWESGNRCQVWIPFWFSTHTSVDAQLSVRLYSVHIQTETPTNSLDENSLSFSVAASPLLCALQFRNAPAKTPSISTNKQRFVPITTQTVAFALKIKLYLHLLKYHYHLYYWNYKGHFSVTVVSQIAPSAVRVVGQT